MDATACSTLCVSRKISRAAAHHGLLLALEDPTGRQIHAPALRAPGAQIGCGAPLLVVGTYRTAEVAPDRPIFDALAELSRERLHARLHLLGFSLDETTTFLRRLSGVDAASTVISSIYEQTAGNPFFVEEVVRHLEGEGRDLASPNIDATTWGIPEGVRDVIAKRVMRLSGETNRVLQAAAVLGDGCAIEPLPSLRPRGPGILRLSAGDAAGMLHEDGDLYAQPSTRPAHLSDGLSLARRQGFHLRAAKALEGGDSPQLHLTAIAVHYRLAGAAGEPQNAIDYSVRAGEAANALFAYTEATSHWRAALELMQKLETAPERTADLLQRLGDLMCVTSLDHQMGIDYLDQYSALLGSAGRRGGGRPRSSGASFDMYDGWNRSAR